MNIIHKSDENRIPLNFRRSLHDIGKKLISEDTKWEEVEDSACTVSSGLLKSLSEKNVQIEFPG